MKLLNGEGIREGPSKIFIFKSPDKLKGSQNGIKPGNRQFYGAKEHC
jgi:hypothetical protein